MRVGRTEARLERRSFGNGTDHDAIDGFGYQAPLDQDRCLSATHTQEVSSGQSFEREQRPPGVLRTSHLGR